MLPPTSQQENKGPCAFALCPQFCVCAVSVFSFLLHHVCPVMLVEQTCGGTWEAPLRSIWHAKTSDESVTSCVWWDTHTCRRPCVLLLSSGSASLWWSQNHKSGVSRSVCVCGRGGGVMFAKSHTSAYRLYRDSAATRQLTLR